MHTKTTALYLRRLPAVVLLAALAFCRPAAGVDISLVTARDIFTDSTFTVHLIADDIYPGLNPVSRYHMRLAYDCDVLRFLGTVVPPDPDTASWKVSFVTTRCHPGLEPPASIYMIADAVDSDGVTLADGAALTALLFEPIAGADTAAADLEFYWSACSDNMLVRGDSLAAVATSVLNAEGVDISRVDQSPPTFAGFADDCAVVLGADDLQAERRLNFHSLRIPLLPTAVEEPGSPAELPVTPNLLQNYPNPFNGTTRMAFDLPERGYWRVVIFDVTGRRARSFTGVAGPGRTVVTWDGTDSRGRAVASGIYVYRLSVGEFATSRRMLLLK